MEKPWERRDDESYAAFEAFNTFLTERTLTKTAMKLGKNLSLIKRWNRQNEWRKRADAWDAEISKEAMARASEDYAKMIERQINIGRMLQGKAVNAIQQMDLTNLPPKFLTALIEMTKVGVNIERSARELNRAKPQEEIFVETLTKIWERGLIKAKENL